MTARWPTPRVALVTGATSAIGQAIVERLGTDGWRVVASSMSGAGGSRAADLRDPAAAEQLVAAAIRDGGQLDLVVHAAARDRRGKVDEQAPDEWWDVVDTQLGGAFHLLRVALPHLEAGSGNIVLVSCEWGVSGRAGATALASAAAGLIGLTKALAREYGPRIRSNCVAPGELSGTPVDPVAYPGVPASVIERPSAAAVAAAVAFLAGPDGVGFNGQVLHPNGGATLA